jgi:hypothetical protein
MEQAIASPKKKIKTGTIVAIGAGVVLLGGGIWALVYFSNKDKEGRAGDGGGSGGSGSGGSGGSGASDSEKQKCSAKLATLGRGSGSSMTSEEIARCKKLLGIPLATGGRPDAVVSGRGFDGQVIYMRSDTPSPIYPAKAFEEEWVLRPVK